MNTRNNKMKNNNKYNKKLINKMKNKRKMMMKQYNYKNVLIVNYNKINYRRKVLKQEYKNQKRIMKNCKNKIKNY